MRLRYAINVTIDGCVHHEAGLPPDEESMAFWTDEVASARALLYGRRTYELMESAWRRPATGEWPEWMGEREIRFAEVIDATPKHVVSSTLTAPDWRAELVTGDLRQSVAGLKAAGAGHLLLFIIASPDTVMTRPNAELLAEVFPDVEVRGEIGEHTTLLSIDKARQLLGYDPQHSWRDEVQ